jgi:aryl-alcohol dehydrogenase-like predicted oxidoreductase
MSEATDLREHVLLGRTGLRVSRLGIAASYGVPDHAIERAYHEHAVNFFYWGSVRRGGMKRALRNLARDARERIVIALQSYDRTALILPRSTESGLRALGIEQADLLILGWYNQLPSRRVLDAALALRERGRVRFLALSGHRRPFFAELLARDAAAPFDAFMIRYNAAHRGAESEVFPRLPAGADARPGIMTYTATRWGDLLKAKRMPPGEPPLAAADCYRFALSSPRVDLCMMGPASERELDEGLRALALGPLYGEELARARRVGDWVHAHASRLFRS